jgi:hypothetical protein
MELVMKFLAKLAYTFILFMTGEGIMPFKLISMFFSLMSQCVMSFVFIALAMGWTTFAKAVGLIDLEKNKMMIVYMVGVCGLHFIMGFLMVFDHEEHHKFHEYQGLQGTLILSIKFIFLLSFLTCLFFSHKKVTSDKSLNLTMQKRYKSWHTVLGLTGTSYLLALPMAVTFANWYLAPFYQHTFILLCVFVM